MSLARAHQPDMVDDIPTGWCRKRPKVGFSDCLVLEIARKAAHLPLGTFDLDLLRFDGTQRLK
ncbi:MAG: hypothetical protein WAK94_07460 [Steroidobacteraceae bacterium]